MSFTPKKFGKFILLDKIASGGMAEIFLAQTVGPGGFEKIVVLKRILPSYSTHQEFISMFIDEAKVTSQLTHSNVVQIYEFGNLEDTYYLSMEYVEGKNLRQILARSEELKRPIPIEHAVYFASKICEGLDYAHRFRDKRLGTTLQIIHRDVSPQNVLISFEGEVKLIDFGIAKTKAQDGKTKSGVLKGKFGYMSPEQASGDPLDQRTDIFSAGIILFEILTRQRLFMSNNDLTTLKKIQEAKIPAPSLFNPDIPFELEEIALKALTKDPSKRYQTARDFHKDLSKFLHTLNPEFTVGQVSAFVRSLFAVEILDHKKKMNEALLYLSQMGQAVAHEDITPEKPAVIAVKRKITSETQTESQTLKGTNSQPSKAQTDLESEHYSTKVWLQLALMGLSIVMLSVLLIYMNHKTDEIVQSLPPLESPEPSPASVPPPESLHVPTTSVVRIDTEPQDAQVYINEKLVGQTPITIPLLPQNQELKLQIRKKGYETLEKNIVLTKPMLNINENLAQQKNEFGLLNIKTDPVSDIYIDDEKIGTTPIIRYRVLAGTHRVRAISQEFNLIAEKNIEIQTDDVKLLNEDDLVFRPNE